MTLNAGSYDLLAPKSGWKAQSVLVVSPYVEKHFFRTVARNLRPKRMHVVIDDGCRRDDLQTVIGAINSCGLRRLPTLKCKLGSACGLVHIKLFYVLWRTPGGHAAHSLVFGSANATKQGFSGEVNAELVVGARLTARAHRDVIFWCKALIAATEADKAVHVQKVRDAELARGIVLRLPAISIGRQVAVVSNFDLWIQRGWLLSDYRPDPGFLHVPIQLARSFPPAELARLAEGEGFAVRQTRSLRYRYVSASFEIEDEEEDANEPEASDIGNWRRRLFVWSNLGEWCSDACLQKYETSFRRRGFDDRVLALEQLGGLRRPTAHALAKIEFVSRVKALWSRFGDDANTLLKGNRELNVSFYEKLFDQRVQRDFALADDKEFQTRFLRGFELVEVPRFRNDIAGWRSFVDSLARQLVLESTRGRSQSMLLKAVREAVSKDKVGQSALSNHHKLVAVLRDLWQRQERTPDRPAAIIEQYHLLPRPA